MLKLLDGDCERLLIWLTVRRGEGLFDLDLERLVLENLMMSMVESFGRTLEDQNFVHKQQQRPHFPD